MSHTWISNNGTIFNYNADFSGEIRINSAGKEEIIVPAKDLLEFVAYCYVLSTKIQLLEEMNYTKLLILSK